MAAYTARYGTSGATAPQFFKPTGTIREVTSIPAPSAASARVAEWLTSERARGFDNQWVLLDEHIAVVDHDASAAALVGRHPSRVNPLVVYVQRPRVRLG
jgi:hypothetical protein